MHLQQAPEDGDNPKHIFVTLTDNETGAEFLVATYHMQAPNKVQPIKKDQDQMQATHMKQLLKEVEDAAEGLPYVILLAGEFTPDSSSHAMALDKCDSAFPEPEPTYYGPRSDYSQHVGPHVLDYIFTSQGQWTVEGQLYYPELVDDEMPPTKEVPSYHVPISAYLSLEKDN